MQSAAGVTQFRFALSQFAGAVRQFAWGHCAHRNCVSQFARGVTQFEGAVWQLAGAVSQNARALRPQGWARTYDPGAMSRFAPMRFPPRRGEA
jgi:hypothetical protein